MSITALRFLNIGGSAIYILALVGIAIWASIRFRRPAVVGCLWGAVATRVIALLAPMAVSSYVATTGSVPPVLYTVMSGVFVTLFWGLLMLAVLLASRADRSPVR